mgnify:CR=1 FL=1
MVHLTEETRAIVAEWKPMEFSDIVETYREVEALYLPPEWPENGKVSKLLEVLQLRERATAVMLHAYEREHRSIEAKVREIRSVVAEIKASIGLPSPN